MACPYSTYRCDHCEIALTQFDPASKRGAPSTIDGGEEEELILVYLHGGAFTLDDAGDLFVAER